MKRSKVQEIVEESSLKNTIKFEYVNQKGEVSRKYVEVYETSGDMFYGYDLIDNKIKTFKYSRMLNVQKSLPFAPRNFD